jgi:hypothetical protein
MDEPFVDEFYPARWTATVDFDVKGISEVSTIQIYNELNVSRQSGCSGYLVPSSGDGV